MLVVSDHGAKRMDGGIRVNEWLRREGLLATLREPDGVCVARRRRRRLVADGRLGRGRLLRPHLHERQGTRAGGDRRPAADYERVRDDLAERLAAIPDEHGRPIGTKVFKPEDVYPEVNGVAPDLIVHFGDLLWRSVGTIGGDDGVHTFENDTGPDDANHAQDGLFILAGPGIPAAGRVDAHLLDVAPTVLDLLGIDTPQAMRGESLLPRLSPVLRPRTLLECRACACTNSVARRRGAGPGRARRRRRRLLRRRGLPTSSGSAT